MSAPEPPEGADISPDDAERPACPSDDEEGPEEMDDDEDCMPPGGWPPEAMDEAEAEELEVSVEEPDGEAVADQEDDALSSLEEQRPPEVRADLAVADASKLKVPELKAQLKWRGLTVGGNKLELTERLQKAIVDGVGLKETMPRSGRGRVTSGAAHAVAADGGWVQPEYVQRPAFGGSERFRPSPDLGLTSRDHPLCCG